MKVSLELLFHFACDRCSQWWTVADFQWSDKSLTCPHCGNAEPLPEKPTVPSLSPFLHSDRVRYEPFKP